MSEQVLYEGRIDVKTGGAVSNVQELQAKLNALDKVAGVGANGMKTLNGTIDKGAQALGGLQQGSQAISQLMRGNFVGAFAAGANAVKALWVAISANPLAAVVMAVAGFAMYVFKYFDDIKKKSDEAKKNVQDFESEFAEFEKNRKAFEERDTNPVAVAEHLAEKATKVMASKAISSAKANLSAKVESSNNQRDNYKAYLADGGKAEDYADKDRLQGAMEAEETARKVLEIWEDRLEEIYETQKLLREKNAMEATAKANQLANDEKNRINEIGEARAESANEPYPIPDVPAVDTRGEKAEAKYAYDKLSNADKLKVTEKSIGNLTGRAKAEGWTNDNRLERINLLRQRDSLRGAMAKAETKTEGEEGGEEKKVKDRSRFRLGTGRFRDMYDARIHARREASGMERLTYDKQEKKWLTKQELQDKKDGKADGRKKADDAVVTSEVHLKKIAEALCG